MKLMKNDLASFLGGKLAPILAPKEGLHQNHINMFRRRYGNLKNMENSTFVESVS